MKTLRFEELSLSKELEHAIKDLGFEEATPIQSEAIPYLLQGRDVIGQAQTGTGKTAAFGIPAIERLDPSITKPQTLVLCPTRELAIQVAEELSQLAKYKKNVRILPIYGGQPIERQISALRRGVEIIIATPGRMIDHLERRTVSLDAIKTIVLDEADEMLDMGFVDAIESILKQAPRERQTVFFSATLPKEITNLTKRYQKDPQVVRMAHKEVSAPKIEQIYFEITRKQKLDALTRLIDVHNIKLGLVFCNTKRMVDELVGHLQARGYSADALHGDLRQNQRDKVMNKFRKGTLELLVATDVAARGIDVDNIEAVFNYDMPQDEEYYVHRIGRTGRAGKEGRAFTFVSGSDMSQLRDIQRYTKATMRRETIPSQDDVETLKANAFIEKVKAAITEGDLAKYTHRIEKLMSDDISSLDVAAALLKLATAAAEKEIPQQTSNDRERSFNNDDRRERSRSPFERRERSGSGDRSRPTFERRERSFDKKAPRGARSGEGMTKLFISIGSNQNVRPADIVGAIAGEVGVAGKSIGSIDVGDNFTFVEVPRESVDDVLRIMPNVAIRGNKIKIGLAKESK